jgi:hypothetical protein
MKLVLLAGVLLLNYCFENIQLSYSKNKQHYQVVATSNFMSRKAIVLVDVDLKKLFVESSSIKKQSREMKKTSSAQSFYQISDEGWMMFTGLL